MPSVSAAVGRSCRFERSLLNGGPDLELPLSFPVLRARQTHKTIPISGVRVSEHAT